MKKFTSILLMLFFALSGLFAANMKGGEVFYLTPHTTWNSDNARYAIYFFNNSTGKNTWASMSKVEGESNLWTGTVPAGDWANLIFCRMNPSASSNGWGSGVFWGGQTQDLTWDGTKNWFKVDSSKDAWNKPAGTWSTYTPPTPDPEPEPEPEPEGPDTPVDPEDPDTPVDPEDPDTPVDPEDPDTPVEPATTITISFASDWETANFYAWNDAATLTAAWPGDEMTAADGKFTYEFTLPEGAYSFIINNGNGTQTVDTEGVAESTCFVIDENKAGKWTLAVSADCEATDPKPIETSYVLMGVGGDWNTGIAMTPNPDNADEYVVMGQAISAATDAVKVVVFSSEGTIYCGTVKEGSAEYTQDAMQNIVLADGTYDFYYSISENAIYIGASLSPDPDQPVDPEDPDQPVDPEDPDQPVDPEDPDQPVDPEDPDQPVDPEDPDTPVEPATTITISFASDWETANFYAWNDAATLTAAWPGDEMTAADGKFTYEFTLPEGAYSFIINNGNGVQTLDTEGVAESTCFVLDENKAGKWTLAVSADCEAVEPKPIETSYVLMGVGGDWATGIAMTPNPDNADEYVVKGQAIAATDAVKVVVFSAEGTNYCGNVKDGSAAVTYDDMGNIMLAEGTYDFYYSISENAIYIGESLTPDPDQPVDPEDPDTPVDPEDPDQPVDPEDPDQPVDPEDPDQPVDPEDPDQPIDPEDPDQPVDPEPATTITISFASDWETANFYAWNTAGELTATWPGDAMTAADGKFTYELTLPEGAYSFIINNGNGTQTVNNEGVAESTCFVLDESQAGKWTLAVSAECEATDPKPIVTSYVLMGVGGDWATGIAMTPNPDNADEYVVKGQAIAATDAVKVVVFSAEGTNYCGNVKDGSAAVTYDDMGNIMLAEGTYDFYYSISENAIYIGESLTPDPDQPVDPEDPDTPVDPEPVMITLYYVNNQGWSSVNAYAWGDAPIADWPGEAATKTELTAKGYDVYSYTFDSSLAANIIFNGDGNQTGDLEFDPATPYFYIDQWYASLEDIEALVSVEEVAAFAIYATNGTIYADCEFAIYNLIGVDVTAQNGSLNGKYIVKTEKGSKLISVW